MIDFKVGDRVRATLGENVLEGIVADMSGRWIDIRWGDEPNESSTINTSWHIEKVSPPLPTKFGAVIRRADRAVFAHALAGMSWYGQGIGWVRSEVAAHGGFEVIFEGVESDE